MLHNFRGRLSETHANRLISACLIFSARAAPERGIAVSYDSRPASRRLAHALLAKMRGRTVFILGQATTPVASEFGLSAGVDSIHVTASHAPLDYVGLKLLRSGASVTVEEEMTLRRAQGDLLGPKAEHLNKAARYVQLSPGDTWGKYAKRLRDRLEIIPGAVVEVRQPWKVIFGEFFPELQIIGRDGADIARLGTAATGTENEERVIRIDEDADQVILWERQSRVPGDELAEGLFTRPLEINT